MSDFGKKLVVGIALASMCTAALIVGRATSHDRSPTTTQVEERTGSGARASYAAHDLLDAELANGRAILSRAWFDKLPANRKDSVTVAIFLGGGIGFFEIGSTYRFSLDILEFERNGTHLAITQLADGKTHTTGFKVSKCDEKPPFDLCLDFDKPLQGPARLYGFSYEEDEAAQVPWIHEIRKAH